MSALPAITATRRMVPRSIRPRTAVSFSSPGQSSCFSMQQEGCAATMRRIAEGAMTTPVPCG